MAVPDLASTDAQPPHQHPANVARHDDLSWQDRIPDQLTAVIGTMKFIYWSTVVIGLWIALNSLGMFVWRWDPYPFVFLNLGFSAFAYYSAPLILMSQNRQTEHDRVRAEHDFEVNEESLAWGRAIGARLGVEVSVSHEGEGC
jgi:uncharacterized membrane protein